MEFYTNMLMNAFNYTRDFASDITLIQAAKSLK